MTTPSTPAVLNAGPQSAPGASRSGRRLAKDRRLLATAAAAAVLGLAFTAPADADTGDTGGGAGRVDHRTYQASTGTNDYLVYVPKGWTGSERLPLYVNLHGCSETAAQQMGASLLNQVADRERFIVAYPDNGGQCWRAVSNIEASITRGGGGDADIVAGITRQVIASYNVNTERVYVAGISSGAFQASAAAAAYPDLYAAVGMASGGGYGMDVFCVLQPDFTVPVNAARAVAQMGSRAHVMPTFTVGGDLDALGEMSAPSGCTRLAYEQWLITNNLLKPRTDGDTFRPDPASTTTGQVPDGYTWTREMARGRDGCQISERWIVHGMGHHWSGGSTDPIYSDPQGPAGGFDDPKGPSASEASWRFFRNFTLTGGNTACH
jgi:poly(3-hydroxybutyrate) depolymerase